ncbi:hypothetical protein J2847_005889 [Azospirillum agricola]|uniref:DUF1937 family protein n=1 Tax=Azospirillum agricola TaxID=1720247 RepID=UPI001AE79FBD|nr:DUF1937 family protein [Azospirillum agricola]MBP2232560.1 hypothetical protein [Azospirillum agricola]
MSFWYLATPYSQFAGGIAAAFRAACDQAAVLVKAGIPVFAPIVHTHPIAILGGLDPRDHGIWLPADAPFMAAARGLIVCKLPGWTESFGIAEEIKAFQAMVKPIVYMQPGDVPAPLRVGPDILIETTRPLEML